MRMGGDPILGVKYIYFALGAFPKVNWDFHKFLWELPGPNHGKSGHILTRET